MLPSSDNVELSQTPSWNETNVSTKSTIIRSYEMATNLTEMHNSMILDKNNQGRIIYEESRN